ncbi:hypothetical protein CRT23_27190 [Methylobacterium sp. V23]|nr:hypothetical protein CRT23_27190 [Methylobacterium sp. V23]
MRDEQDGVRFLRQALARISDAARDTRQALIRVNNLDADGHPTGARLVPQEVRVFIEKVGSRGGEKVTAGLI